MSFRHCMAANLTPLLLRVTLGVVFIWAGWSKVGHVDYVTGDTAQAFARAGMITADTPVVTASEDSAAPAGADGPGDLDDPVADDGEEAAPAPDGEAEGAGEEIIEDAGEAAEAVGEAIEDAGEEVEEAASEVAEGLDVDANERERFAASLDTTKSYEVKRLKGLGVAMQGAIDRDQWPGFLSSAGAISAMAWAAALIEFLCGAMILAGLLTRLSALGLAGVMAGAMWMTMIGPALVAPEPAFLGFLPPLDLSDGSGAWMETWPKLMFQFTLLMVAVGVFFSGAGKLSIDGIMFREKRDRARSED